MDWIIKLGEWILHSIPTPLNIPFYSMYWIMIFITPAIIIQCICDIVKYIIDLVGDKYGENN